MFGVKLKPHSDSSGVLTILIDKDVGGLQVLRDGVWHNSVPASSPFRLLINVGDFVEAVGLTTLTDADN